MAHEIHEHDTLLLAKSGAWHGLGKVLPDTFSVDEALGVGGIGWETYLVPLETVPIIGGPMDGARLPVSNKAVLRSDTNEILGIVGKNYVPVQNRDVLTSLQEAIELANSEAKVKIHSCGSLFNGRKIFICTELYQFQPATGDEVKVYGLFTDTKDGTECFTGGRTAVRTVCSNTLRIGLAEAQRNGSARKAKHNSAVHLKVNDIARNILLGVEAAKQFQQQAISLVNTKPKESDIQGIYKKLYSAAFGTPESEDEVRKGYATIAVWESLRQNRRNTMGNEADGSLWSIFNSITEWSDHRTGRGLSQDAERRFNSNIGGQSAAFKDLIFQEMITRS